MSRASLRKLQSQRLMRLARSRSSAQKEIVLLIRLIHPFASPDLTTDDIFTVDASDFMYWTLEWKHNQSMFVSWASFLASCLADYCPKPAVAAPASARSAKVAARCLEVDLLHQIGL